MIMKGSYRIKILTHAESMQAMDEARKLIGKRVKIDGYEGVLDSVTRGEFTNQPCYRLVTSSGNVLHFAIARSVRALDDSLGVQ